MATKSSLLSTLSFFFVFLCALCDLCGEKCVGYFLLSTLEKMWLNRTMIATLRGEVSQIEENAIVVEVGGVGLRVFVPRLSADGSRRVKQLCFIRI